MDVIGPTSENSPATPTPRHNRRRTRSATSNDGDASRKKSTQKKQREEEIPKGKEDDYAKGVTSENSAATPTLTRMRTCTVQRVLMVIQLHRKNQQDGESTKGHEDDYAKGVTSENSASAPTPTRMRTCSSKSTDGDPNRQSSSQKKQPDAQNMKGNEDDDDVFQCQICNKTFTDFVQIKQHKNCLYKD